MWLYKLKQSSALFLQEKQLLSQDTPPVVNCLILAWFANFDLVVSMPNGRRETHLMALEFMENSGSVSSCSDARYIASHVHAMGQPAGKGIKADFLKVRHVCQHNDRMLNAAFQDQFGEQTMIR